MKQWRQVLSHIPKRLREQHRLKAHMRKRPSGTSRVAWANIWCQQHLTNWSIAERAHVARVPKMSVKGQRRTSKARCQTVITTDFLQTFEWRQLRMKVLTKRGNRCECCGASPRDGATVINIDHIKPRRLFPELALVESNLQVLCSACNHGKGNWDQTDWREHAPSPESVEWPANWNEPMWTKQN